MRRRTDGKIGKRCLSSSTSPQNAGGLLVDGTLGTVRDARPITAVTQAPSASIPRAQPFARLPRMANGKRIYASKLTRNRAAARIIKIPKPISSPRCGRIWVRRTPNGAQKLETGAIITTPIKDTKPTENGFSDVSRR
jgi:hypothetical protein